MAITESVAELLKRIKYIEGALRDAKERVRYLRSSLKAAKEELNGEGVAARDQPARGRVAPPRL